MALYIALCYFGSKDHEMYFIKNGQDLSDQILLNRWL